VVVVVAPTIDGQVSHRRRTKEDFSLVREKTEDLVRV